MPAYIALIRGINVGGNKKVPMEKLRGLCERLGCERVQTYIQSGNVVFQEKRTAEELAVKIEAEIAREFGFTASVILRTTQELERAMGNSPFSKQSKRYPDRVFIAFLSDAPKAEAAKRLEALATKDEQVRCLGKEVHMWYENGIGRAKLNGSVVERVLAVRATARNWNTCNKLYQMALERPALSSE